METKNNNFAAVVIGKLVKGMIEEISAKKN